MKKSSNAITNIGHGHCGGFSIRKIRPDSLSLGFGGMSWRTDSDTKCKHNRKTLTIMDKEYSNGEITITWRPKLCQHAGVCVKLLPKVYNPKAKPWIQIENATTAQLKDQVSQCPSGALSYRTNE